MIYAIAICLVLVTCLSVYQSLKIKRMVAAQAETNKALNETRTLVAKHQKYIRNQKN